ncbi:MAG: hypothetical protein H6546_05010 [Chitinophagales bacterium]|nr:hypothetical protein [Chitinophagales bacterium]
MFHRHREISDTTTGGTYENIRIIRMQPHHIHSAGTTTINRNSSCTNGFPPCRTGAVFLGGSPCIFLFCM